MATEGKSIDMTKTKTEDELELELRYKLFDALVEDYNGFEGCGQQRNHKIQIDSSLLNRDGFLFGCKGIFREHHIHSGWFFYFVNKIVIIHIPNDGTFRNVQEYFKVYEYGSNLSYISIYDVAKIVFRHLTARQLEKHRFQPATCENTNNFSLDLDLDIDKPRYSGGRTLKWFDLDSFQFEKHINNGIIMTIRSHIRKMIAKNEQNEMNAELSYIKLDLIEESNEWSGNKFEDIENQLEKQSKIISIQGSQLSDMNALILRMQSQMEEQSKIILEQQSNMNGNMNGMKKIMANMLREQQSTKSEMDMMSRQLEEQSKLIESLQIRDEKKRVEQSTLESEIDMILNGEI